MEICIHKTPGIRNDLLVKIPRSELDTALLHIANRERLLAQTGLTRHCPLTADQRQVNRDCKISVEQHLVELGLLDERGCPRRRSLVLGNRNLGNNHGVVAWQAAETRQFFQLADDRLRHPSYSCLVAWRSGGLAMIDLKFEQDGRRVVRAEDGRELTDEIAWATYGQQVLRAGGVVSIEDILHECYDIRHVFAFDLNRAEGREIAAFLYGNYPDDFRTNALAALNERGVPRNRYLHSCLGLSRDHVFILQREGTPEEVGHWLREAGAEDGLIFDNGGSVSCWASWLYPRGGFLYAAPDYRPVASSIIALVLKGPPQTELPGGSVSYAIV